MPTKTEQEIRARLDDWLKAVQNKDIDGMMSSHSSDVRVFDLHSNMQTIGIQAARQAWEECMPMFEGPVEYEIRDLQITAGEDVAFHSSLNRIGVTVHGYRRDTWLRVTVGYQKADGRWTVKHVHVSVPADMQTGTALLGLTP